MKNATDSKSISGPVAGDSANHFSQAEFAPTLKSWDAAAALPARCYWSPEWYRREVEEIFLKQWLCVGRVDQVAKPGDYFTIRLLGEPLVIVRDEQDQIHALSTVCRHRAMEVVEGQGSKRSFQCPYHAWTYSLRGELIGAPEMDQTAGFSRSECRLPETRLETWEGFIFVNFDRSAEPLSPKLADLSKRLTNYQLADLCSTEPVVFEGKWNWKLMIENAMEFYHVLGLHQGPHDAMLARLAITEDFNGTYEAVRGRFAEPGGTLWTESGNNSPFPVIDSLTPDQRQRGDFFLIYPTHVFFVLPDSMVYYQTLPEGPDRMTLRINICLPRSTVQRADFEQSLKAARDALLYINEQDMWACASVQRGLSSRMAPRGRYSHLEQVIWQIAQYVMRRVRRHQTDVSAA